MVHNDDNRPLREFATPKADGIQLGYIVPTVEANNFELKPALSNMLSQYMFHDLANEDTNQHWLCLKNCVILLGLTVLSTNL
jgi:hypothetical protein